MNLLLEILSCCYVVGSNFTCNLNSVISFRFVLVGILVNLFRFSQAVAILSKIKFIGYTWPVYIV